MADAHKAAGNESFKEGRYAEAAQHFTAAIDLDPGNAVLRSNRWWRYFLRCWLSGHDRFGVPPPVGR